jgi:antitoxin (DNA-binding transcriptional repressor) of toxin-antitoxin stability system
VYILHPYVFCEKNAMQTISATELARNTRDVLDRVAIGGEIVTIARNHTAIARLMPPERVMTASQALAGLRLPTLTPKQAANWLKDSKGVFNNAVRDPWR